MPDVKTPVANPPTRRERARATRLRVMRAAYTLFCERGYAGTTMADVAEAAGVAVQTVYFTFHTKHELLSSAYELAVLGERDPLPPKRQSWYVAAEAEPDVVGAMRLLVEGVGEIVARAAPLDLVVRAAGSRDPEALAVWTHHEDLRVEGFRAMVDLLGAKATFRKGMASERATDLLLFYLGPHAYAGLVMDRGWTHGDWLDWTAATLFEQLVGVPPGA